MKICKLIRLLMSDLDGSRLAVNTDIKILLL